MGWDGNTVARYRVTCIHFGQGAPVIDYDIVSGNIGLGLCTYIITICILLIYPLIVRTLLPTCMNTNKRTQIMKKENHLRRD